jgi:hypothetical protein
MSRCGRCDRPPRRRRATERPHDQPPYDHGVLSPGLLAVLLVTALLALFPARRLHLSGYPTIVVGAYFGLLWLLGILIALGPGRSRLFLPLILVLYLVPFLTWRAGLERLLGRRPPPPPPRNVTPPAEADRPNSHS